MNNISLILEKQLNKYVEYYSSYDKGDLICEMIDLMHQKEISHTINNIEFYPKAISICLVLVQIEEFKSFTLPYLEELKQNVITGYN